MNADRLHALTVASFGAKKRTGSRAGRIGSADLAGIMNRDRYSTPLRVQDRFLGREFEDDDAVSEAAFWGSMLEPLVLCEMERRLESQVVVPSGEFVHPDHEWLRVNVDAHFPGRKLLGEAKTCNQYKSGEWGPGVDEIPEAAIIQSQGAMAVLRACGEDIEGVAVGVLVGGQSFRLYVIDYHQRLAESVIAHAVEFYENHCTPPFRTPDPASTAEANRLWPDESDRPGVATATEEHLRILREYAVADAQQKRAQKLADDAKLRLRKILGATGVSTLKVGLKSVARWAGNGLRITTKNIPEEIEA